MATNRQGFDVYYDSLTEALWFSSLNPAFDIDKNNYHIIEHRGNNTALVDDITKYDKPDIILIKENKPLLVIEITQEVPTGHNVGQRFARLVRSIEMGIPTIYFFPFDAKKHGQYANMCNLNIRLIQAAMNILKIHNTPLLCMNWVTDDSGEIITDGTENDEIIALLKSYVDSGFDKNCEGIQNYLKYMQQEYKRRLRARPSYADLPPSVEAYTTKAFIRQYNVSGLSYEFCNRDKTYVYIMKMTPEKCKRQDPYTGTQFIYDYLVCRSGPSVEDKKNNLVLYFPKLTVNTWNQKNPNDLTTKSCNWYLTANMLLFKDGYLLLR